MEKARDFTRKIFKLLLKPELRILPGHLAFFLMMTIIPLVALIATLAASLSISPEGISQTISDTIPSEISSIINSIIKGNGINFNIIVFYISALLLASNGTFSMINTSNEIYKVEPDNILSRRLKAVLMILILVCLFLFLLIIPIFSNGLFGIIKELTDNGQAIGFIQKTLIMLRYPIVLVILFINIKMMYVIAPDKQIVAKTTNKGAIFTTIGWVLSTEIFAFYVERFAKYDIFYGSISNILVLLIWVYLLSYIFVLGMIINVSNYKED